MGKRIRIWIACMLSLMLVIGGAMPVSAAEQTQTAQEATQCADLREAAVVLREEMVKRRSPISVSFPAQSDDPQVITEVMGVALAHTGVPTQGDYLRWSVRKCSAVLDAQEQDGQYMLTLTYTATYYTTEEQETQLNAAVEQLLEQLDVFNAGDYEKISAVYDYICDNVQYDSWGVMIGDKLVYSAYAALLQNRAVCQGYATLFYRLALELGVDARLIAGTSRGSTHGWNIVRLNGKFYNVDATWDAELAQAGKPYENFLKCDASFTSHARRASYTTEEFQRVYYMAQEDYSDSQTASAGDLTGDGRVDEEDAIYLLQSVLMSELFPVNQAVDYTMDSKVCEDDAIYLLLYVLMPDSFPI